MKEREKLKEADRCDGADADKLQTWSSCSLLQLGAWGASARDDGAIHIDTCDGKGKREEKNEWFRLKLHTQSHTH